MRRPSAVPLRIAALVWCCIGCLDAQNQPAAANPPAKAPANPPAEFVGSQVCQACHEDIYNSFEQSPHRAIETEKKYHAADHGCESCHGPGSNHIASVSAADIVNPAKVSAAQADRICLTCHLNQPTQAGRIFNSHARNEVSCGACHSIHKYGPLGLVARKHSAVNALCSNCHFDVWASFQRVYRHRLPEGAMDCVDCHNPHGSFLPDSQQVAYANEPGCFRCHSDLRGPFVFEHAPVQLEGCTACHEPHGSANPRMLTRAQIRFVCLECHANLPTPAAPSSRTLGTVPPAFHNLLEPRFRECATCHQKVHGSYVSRDLLK
jgi:DmsE family decaheme c-type cytochrome